MRARQIAVSTVVVKGSPPWALSFLHLCRTAGEMRSRGIHLTSGPHYTLSTLSALDKIPSDPGTQNFSTHNSVAMALHRRPHNAQTAKRTTHCLQRENARMPAIHSQSLGISLGLSIQYTGKY